MELAERSMRMNGAPSNATPTDPAPLRCMLPCGVGFAKWKPSGSAMVYTTQGFDWPTSMFMIGFAIAMVGCLGGFTGSTATRSVLLAVVFYSMMIALWVAGAWLLRVREVVRVDAESRMLDWKRVGLLSSRQLRIGLDSVQIQPCRLWTTSGGLAGAGYVMAQTGSAVLDCVVVHSRRHTTLDELCVDALPAPLRDRVVEVPRDVTVRLWPIYSKNWTNHCPGCGYDTSGLAQPVTCPECGHKPPP